MGILNWLTLQRAGKTGAELELGEDEGEFSGLDLESAIEVHRAWRRRLYDALQDTGTERLGSAEAGRGDLCALGRWLVGAGGQTYGHLAEHGELMRAHAKFHIAASAVLIAHNNGKRGEAFRILNDDFQRLSDQVQLELARLFVRAKSEGRPSRGLDQNLEGPFNPPKTP